MQETKVGHDGPGDIRPLDFDGNRTPVVQAADVDLCDRCSGNRRRCDAAKALDPLAELGLEQRRNVEVIVGVDIVPQLGAGPDQFCREGAWGSARSAGPA